MSQSQGTQLSVSKKSNVLDKKPNILNSGKKTSNHDQSNNNNNSVDNNDSGPTNKQEYSSPPSQAAAPAVPEVTVSLKLAPLIKSVLQVSLEGCRPQSNP